MPRHINTLETESAVSVLGEQVRQNQGGRSVLLSAALSVSGDLTFTPPISLVQHAPVERGAAQAADAGNHFGKS